MKTIEREIANMIEEHTPPGTQFCVAAPNEEQHEVLDIFGPFESWRDAADWNRLNKPYGVVHPLQVPRLNPRKL